MWGTLPYIRSSEDYKKIIEKAKKLRKYNFDWYIDRIIPHIQKMVDAKEGNIDVEHFKNMIQKAEKTNLYIALLQSNLTMLKLIILKGGS